MRGRRTLEEGVLNVAAKRKTAVLPWCIRDTVSNRLDEEEDWDEEKEEGGAVVI